MLLQGQLYLCLEAVRESDVDTIVEKMWPVATYVCESWTLRKNEQTHPDAFYKKELRKILQVSWTSNKTNEWFLNKAGVKREPLDTVKAMKLAYYGHTMRKQRSCLEKEIMQGSMSGARRRGKPRMAWMGTIQYVDKSPRGRINQNDRGHR